MMSFIRIGAASILVLLEEATRNTQGLYSPFTSFALAGGLTGFFVWFEPLGACTLRMNVVGALGAEFQRHYPEPDAGSRHTIS